MEFYIEVTEAITEVAAEAKANGFAEVHPWKTPRQTSQQGVALPTCVFVRFIDQQRFAPRCGRWLDMQVQLQLYPWLASNRCSGSTKLALGRHEPGEP